MGLRILVAPACFKENLQAYVVASHIAAGVLRAAPDARVHKVPLVDGGEGFAAALVKATGGTLHKVVVRGPAGGYIESHFGFLAGTRRKTAVLEMAAAAGLRLVPHGARDPRKTTTFGVGELIKRALDEGAEKVLIGCADSGTNDGGAGLAQALGVRLLDVSGSEIGMGGGELLKLAKIDLSALDPRIGQVQFDAVCNLHSVLCGPSGTSRLFGPQKGASPEAVEELAAALENYAVVIQRDLGLDVRTMPGGGAAGGLGAALRAFLGAALRPRFDVIMEYLEFDRYVHACDLVITGEGCVDYQTRWNKIPGEVAKRAKRYNKPVVALAGMMGRGANENYHYGLDSFISALDAPVTLEDAMAKAPENLERAAERLIRLILVGRRLSGSFAMDQALRAVKTYRIYQGLKAHGEDPGRVERLRSRYLEEMSRELRTPLHIVLNLAEMVREGTLGEVTSAQRKALEQISRHSLEMFGLIDGVIQASQSETGSPLIARDVTGPRRRRRSGSRKT